MHEDIEVYLRKGKGVWCDNDKAYIIDNMEDEHLINVFVHIARDLWIYKDQELKEKKDEIKAVIIKRNLENEARRKLGKYSDRFEL